VTATPAHAPRPSLSDFLFNAAGRCGRPGYLAGVILAAALTQAPAILPAGWAHRAVALTAWPVGFVIWGVLSARRLHDFGRAGWWFAILAALFIAGGGRVEASRSFVQLACAALCAAGVALLLVWPGEHRFNRFGPAPRQGG
jgi:uncharacterized membrane protein YhaH (DUF805 family)